MRPLHLTVVTVVSTAVLLATTSVFAVTPKVNLGLLKAQEAWKVGTVDNNGQQYCAMVGTYSNNVVVAFARNPDGLGSLALDFGDTLFTPGKQYDVSLTADGQSPRTMKAQASAERSLVIQVGQDGSFYDALSQNGTLGIDMPAATLRIDLTKFATSHKDLVECASTLSPAAPSAQPVIREAKTNVDRELEQLGQARTQLADASAKADTLQESIDKKASSFDDIEAQLEAEARAEAKRSRETIASIEAKQTEVRTALQEKGVNDALDLAVLEPAAGVAAADLPMPTTTSAPSGGRKLLAAIGSREPIEQPFSTGSSSRDLEARELGLADADRAAAETAQALDLKNEIASLEKQKNEQAQQQMAAFDSRQQELSAQTEQLSEKRDATLAKLSAAAAAEENSRKLRADVVAQQSKIAAVTETKQAETANLSKNLASTQSDFEARIAALEAERAQLRDQVQAVTAENARLKQTVGQGNPDDLLEIARLKKQMMEMETQRQGELARATAAQQELDASRQQLALLRQGGATEQSRLASLQRELDETRAQLNQQRVNIATAESQATAQERAKLDAVQKTIDQRQADLDQQARVLSEESQRVAREKEQLAAVSVKSAAEDQTVLQERAKLEAAQKTIDQRQADLDKQARVLAEESQRVTRDKEQLAQLPVKSSADDQVTQAERSKLAALQKTLEQRQTELDQQARVLAEESQRVARDKEQLALAPVKSDADDQVIQAERSKLAALQKSLEQRQTELDHQARVLAEESQRVARDKEQLASAPLAAPVPLMPSVDGKILSPGQAILASSQRLVDSERAELNDLRGRIQSLESDLAAARAQASVAAVAVAAAPQPLPAPVVINEMSAEEKAELARLKNENVSLRQRLAGFLSGSNTVAEKSTPVVEKPAPVTLAAPVSVAPETTLSKVVPLAVEQAAPVSTPVVAAPAPVPTPVASSVKVSPALAALGLTPRELNATEPSSGETVTLPVKNEKSVVAANEQPGNDKRMPAVPAAVVTSEVVTAPVKTVETAPVQTEAVETTVETVVEEAAVPEVAVSQPAPQKAQAVATSNAELEITRLSPITASVPRETIAQPVVSKEVEKQDKGVFGIFGRAMGYGAASARAEEATATAQPAVQQQAAARPAIIRVTYPQPVAQPVVAQPVATPNTPNGISSGEANRAAAFLDNIMAFHRPGDTPSAPVAQIAAAAPTVTSLNAIEAAAGGPSMAAPVPPAPAATIRPASVAPVAAAPVLQPVAASVIDLPNLLQEAGAGTVQFTGGNDAGGNVLREWTTGALNGLYERVPAQGRFETQVEDYLSRYRDDCPGKLDVRLSDLQQAAAGTVRVAEINCNMAGNTYATSIAFLQSAAGFHTVLHAGQSSDSASVRRLGDNIANILKRAETVRVAAVSPAAARVVPVAMTAPVQQAPVERPRFRIEIEAPATAPQGVYDLPTTIIE